MIREAVSLNSRVAGLQSELVGKMQRLLASFDPRQAEDVGTWLASNFRFQSPKTPRGQKDLKEKTEKLRWWLVAGSMYPPDSQAQNVRSAWEDVEPQVGNLVRYFSDEGGVSVPKEMRAGSRVYLNLIGFPEDKLAQYVARLEQLFTSVQGWRVKALQGEMKVALAGPKDFRGTAAGVYKSAQDTMFVRATPKILSRSGGTYGALDYVLIHELGHRYEYKVGLSGNDFDKSQWWTTPYSRKDGEAFAELFALGHFKSVPGTWDSSIQERFEAVMGGSQAQFRELPPHLKALTDKIQPQWKRASGVRVDFGAYEKALRKKLFDLADWSIQSKERSRRSPPDWGEIVSDVRRYLGESAAAQMSPDRDDWVPAVWKQLNTLFLQTQDSDVFAVARKVMKLEDSIGPPVNPDRIRAEAEENFREILAESQEETVRFVKSISAAIDRVPAWGGSAILVYPEFNSDAVEFAPVGSFWVGVGRRDVGFTAFVKHGRLEGVGDQLEAGDADFFRDPTVQTDYFNLIKELQQPGSSSKGKFLTLYTARPIKDRDYYEKTRALPVGVFLSSSPHDAAGLAHDLGGSEERDVWRVSVHDTHLVQTLDTPTVRHYQVVGRQPAPVRSISMHIEGREASAILRVAARCYQRIATRLIHIDQDQVNDLLDDFQSWARTQGRVRGTKNPVGDSDGFLGYVTLQTPWGEGRQIPVAFRPGSHRGGGFGHLGPNMPIVLVWFDRRLTWGALATDAMLDDLNPTLQHELTHALDKLRGPSQNPQSGDAPRLEDLGISPAQYFNSPDEVRAYMRTIYEEIAPFTLSLLMKPTAVAKLGVRQIIENQLRSSPTWKMMSKHLTPKNHNRILKGIVTSLQEAAAKESTRVAAKYKKKKKVPKADGKGTTTVYEYSERQIANRNKAKAERVEKLRKNIDKLREKVREDLKSKDESVRNVALAVGLIDKTFERVGNNESAKDGHVGVTGWKVKHLTVGKDKITIKYTGKSGVKHEKVIDHAVSVAAIKAAIKGKGEDDLICGCSADDVNEYLKPFDVTAKDLRGFHANDTMQTRLKAIRSKGGDLPDDKKDREKKLKDEFKKALEETAEIVGHEASTLKSQYLVPGLEEMYLKDGKVEEKLTKKKGSSETCPSCAGPYQTQCRCRVGERTCKKGHRWARCPTHDVVVVLAPDVNTHVGKRCFCEGEKKTLKTGSAFVMRPEGWEATSLEAHEYLGSLQHPRVVFRGMTHAEYRNTVGAGKPIESTGAFSHRTEGTNFARDPRDAESYVNFGRDDPRKTGKPTYLVEVSRLDTMIQSSDGYVKSLLPVPYDAVKRVWEMYPDNGAVMARRIKTASLVRKGRRDVLEPGLIKRLREEFLMLVKNVPRIQNYRVARLWKEALTRWGLLFESMLQQIREDLNSRKRSVPNKPQADESWVNYYLQHMKPLWDFEYEVRNGIEIPDMGYVRKYKPWQTEESLFAGLPEELRKWDQRVRRKALAAWKWLDDYQKWTAREDLHGGGGERPVIEFREREISRIEGVQTVLIGFDPSRSFHQEGLAKLKAGLAEFKMRASRVYPWLLQNLLPIEMEFSGDDTSYAGRYEGDHISLSIWGIHSDPKSFAKTLAHEMGHHIHRAYLSEEATKTWSLLIRGGETNLDLRDVLKMLRPGESLSDLEDRIERTDPVLHLQLKTLIYDPSYSGHDLYSLRSIQEFLDEGKGPIVRVPIKPITGYAAKNPEEAFCETLGLLVGYGPRTLDPEVISWLKARLPGVKVASRVARRYLRRWRDARKIATKTPHEKEEEETERLSRPAPKYKPPRHDLRRERVQVEDKDVERPNAENDRDLSLNYKKRARNQPHGVYRDPFRPKPPKKPKPPPRMPIPGARPVPQGQPKHQPGDVWKSKNPDGQGKSWAAKNPDGVTQVFKDKAKAKAYAEGRELDSEKDVVVPPSPLVEDALKSIQKQVEEKAREITKKERDKAVARGVDPGVAKNQAKAIADQFKAQAESKIEDANLEDKWPGEDAPAKAKAEFDKAVRDLEREFAPKKPKDPRPDSQVDKEEAPPQAGGIDQKKVEERARGLSDYPHVRDYTDEELENEAGEYFENAFAKALAPGAFESPEALIQKIRETKTKTLSDEDYGRLRNTDAPEILAAENPKELFRARAKEYDRDPDRIERGFEEDEALPPPIVLRDKGGSLYLMAGNTRLMGSVAAGVRLPVKIIDVDAAFDFASADAAAKREGDGSEAKAKVDKILKKLRLPPEQSEALSATLEGLSPEEHMEYAQAFDEHLSDLRADPEKSMTKKSLKTITKALQGLGEIEEGEDGGAAGLGRKAALAYFAKTELANPSRLGGQKVTGMRGDKPLDQKALDDRARESLDHFKRLTPELRQMAFDAIAEHVGSIPDDSQDPADKARRAEFERILDGMSLAAALNDEVVATSDGTELRPPVPPSAVKMAQLLDNKGELHRMLQRPEDRSTEAARKVFAETVAFLQIPELIDLAGGTDGKYSEIIRGMQDPKIPYQSRATMRLFLQSYLVMDMAFEKNLMVEALDASKVKAPKERKQKSDDALGGRSKSRDPETQRLMTSLVDCVKESGLTEKCHEYARKLEYRDLEDLMQTVESVAKLPQNSPAKAQIKAYQEARSDEEREKILKTLFVQQGDVPRPKTAATLREKWGQLLV